MVNSVNVRSISRRTTHPTRVLCVDDSADMTSMMRMLIDAEPMMQCVGCLASADHLIQKVRDLKLLPDVVLLDATMPGKSPLDEMKRLATEFPAIRTIVFSGHDDAAFVAGVRDKGAWGCVSKRDEPDAILLAVREVAAGNTWFPSSGR
jgi:DNA-binding NarL/FixJ family response regulator